MADIFGSGNKEDKWTKKATYWINWLNDHKQTTLTQGDNITLTPQQDGTVRIDASGGSAVGALDDLSDVVITTPTNGQALVYDGQNWVNEDIQTTEGEYEDGWELIAKNTTTVSYKQKAGEIVFFYIYWNAYQLYAVHIGRNGTTLHSAQLASGGNIGTSPTFSYDSNTNMVTATWGSNNYVKIFRGYFDIKGDCVQTLLWDYRTDNNNTIPYGLYNFTLHENINNYDEIVIEFASYYGDFSSQYWRTVQFVTNVNALNNAYETGKIVFCTFDTRSSAFYINGTTFQKLADNGTNINGLVRVYGVKYRTNFNSYSTEEKVIGRWLDDSTLYQKTKILDFSDLTQDGIQYYVAIGESGENVKKVEGYAKSDDYGICILGSRNYETNNHANDYYWEFSQYGNNVSLIFAGYNASDIDVSEIVITYQYTKT